MQIQLRRDTFVCIQMRMQINGKEIVAAADAINFTCHADVAPKSASFDVSRATATATRQQQQQHQRQCCKLASVRNLPHKLKTYAAH